jgi:hypothetical protein
MQIHWFSIINSCVTVLLLTGFLATILMRVLKADFLKYSRDDRESTILLLHCTCWNGEGKGAGIQELLSAVKSWRFSTFVVKLCCEIRACA